MKLSILLISLTCFLLGCTSTAHRKNAVGYYGGEWTFNGGHELWLNADGSYIWRQSLFYCCADENGNSGWFNEEYGQWTISGKQIALQKKKRLISNSYVEGLYFERHRIFVIGGSLGDRVLVSGQGEEMMALKEEIDPKKDRGATVPITDLRDHISIVTKEFIEGTNVKEPVSHQQQNATKEP